MTTQQLIEIVANAAAAHPLTVRKRMLGLPVRGKVGERIDAELAKHGVKPVLVLASTSANVPADVDVRTRDAG